MLMDMGGRNLIFISHFVLILLISCDNTGNSTCEPTYYNNTSVIRMDSSIVKKVFARANFIDSLVKKKRLKIISRENKTYKGTYCECMIYSLYWKFENNDKNVSYIKIYSNSYDKLSFTETQYYHDNRNYFYDDPDGNQILVDYGLKLNYSYSVHSFLNDPTSLKTIRSRNSIYNEINIMDVAIFDSIDIWDKRYDKGFFK